MSQHEVPNAVPPLGASEEPSPYWLLLAFGLNIVAVLLYLFGLVAPLTPSHGHPSVLVILIFVGGPIALIWFASRCFSSRVGRAFLYIEILIIVAFSCYLLLVVEHGGAAILRELSEHARDV